MTPFTFHRPQGLQDAVKLLAENAATTKVLAGGQSLLLALKERLLRPTRVISLASLSELSNVETRADGALEIGATTTYATLARTPFIGWQQEIANVAGNLADRSVRSLGTIGGAACQAEPRYDMPVLLSAVGAQMHLLSASGARSLSADDFFNPQGGTNMAADEILLRISIPSATALDALAFEKFRFRIFDAAHTSVAWAMKLNGGAIQQVRIVIGAVAKAPLIANTTARALVGMRPADVHADTLGAQVAAEVAPLLASQNLQQRYQSELIISLTAKAFTRACGSATGA